MTTKGEVETTGRPDWGHQPTLNRTPPPPYQLRGCTFVMVGAQFDRKLAQSLVPDGLEVSDDATGGFYMYVAASGWAVAPFSATLAWVDVKGFDSSDGSKGRAQLVSHYSDPMATIAHGWNALSRKGYCRLGYADGVATGVGGPEGEVHLRMSVQVAADEPTPVAGTHYYLMVNADGVLTQVPVAYSYDWRPAQPLQFQNLAPAGTILQRLVPKQLHWAGYLTGAVITIGEPLPVQGAADASTRALHIVHLNLLAQLGRGAVVLGPDCRVLFENEVARSLHEGGAFSTESGHFHTTSDAEERIRSVVSSLLSGRHVSPDPITLPREGKYPLFVHIVLLDNGAQGGGRRPGDGAVLVLISDPGKGREHDAAQALRLLGLSPAEARLAALVGGGSAPKEAARHLGNTENTVRFSLNQIYRKLGIGRQSELAGIVTRIEQLGV